MSAPEMTEVAERIADIFVRHGRDLRLPRLEDAAIAAGYRVLAEDDIAAGLRALPVLAALDARHQPRPWAGSSTGYVCSCGAGAHPCADRRVLDGKLTEAAA